MNPIPTPNWSDLVGKTLVLEARSGPARSRVLSEWAGESRGDDSRGWLLNVDFDHGGPWAGIRKLFSTLVEELGNDHSLVQAHTHELIHAVPELKRSMSVEHPTLTDLASPEEKVRNYPADRAFRIVHGLIDLLDAWKADTSRVPWIFLLDGFENISHIGRRFFRELLRRRGEPLALTLVLTAPPGRGKESQGIFNSQHHGPVLRWDVQAKVPTDSPSTDSERARESAIERATELETLAQTNSVELQIALPELIRLWRTAGRDDKLFRLHCWGLEIYNSQGFYEDARKYGEKALCELDTYAPGDDDLFWLVFFKLFMCHLGLHDADAADRLVRGSKVLDRIQDSRRRGQLQYLIAMLYVRYFPERDLEKGEEHLSEGLQELETGEMPADYYHFYSVFNRNGLALVRHFQGRHEEAIQLCKEGFEELEEHLSEEQHRLHRSVLLYNIGQVYEAMKRFSDAAEYYTAAMEMDPNYSEYYNDRGNIYLKNGELEKARLDYLKAIELSPPYHEVWANLGQCYRRMGQHADAVGAYTRSLDLEPDQALGWIGRAQSLEALDRGSEAIRDYNKVLELDPDLWDVHASRAVLHYEAGDLQASVEDLQAAIRLSPEEPDLYQNRAIVLTDLGRLREARKDLRTYLELRPTAEDRAEVQDRIEELTQRVQAA